MDNYALFAIMLAAVGLGLMIAEVFIPSGGMIFVMATVSVAASVWCAWQAWWVPGEYVWWWSYVGSVVVLLPSLLMSAFYILPRTSFGRRILMAPQDPEELTPYADEAEHLSHLIGKTGEALTLMTPGGLVSIDGERLHCESEGLLIEPHQTVKVVGVKGNRLVVRAVAETTQDSPPQTTADGGPDEESPLDFDLPQS